MAESQILEFFIHGSKKRSKAVSWIKAVCPFSFLLILDSRARAGDISSICTCSSWELGTLPFVGPGSWSAWCVVNISEWTLE